VCLNTWKTGRRDKRWKKNSSSVVILKRLWSETGE
jgi:hypothetical protein